MKLDDDVKMISAEAPVLFAKAAELFIQELTLRYVLKTIVVSFITNNLTTRSRALLIAIQNQYI